MIFAAVMGCGCTAALGQQATEGVSAKPPVTASGEPGAVRAHKLAFDVVSIRTLPYDRQHHMMSTGLPDRFRAVGMPLIVIVGVAYFGFPKTMHVARSEKEKLITGLPLWANDLAVDIEGKVAPEDLEAYQKQGPEKPMMQQMLQTMLEERFGIVAHRLIVEGPVYALVVGKHGAKVRENKADDPDPPGGVPNATGGWLIPIYPGAEPRVRFVKESMAEFAQDLSGSADRPVVDRTGLTGRYEFSLLRIDSELGEPEPPVRWDVDEIGLRLVPTTAPRERLVVDKIEKPSEN